jgi:hypothetical protein
MAEPQIEEVEPSRQVALAGLEALFKAGFISTIVHSRVITSPDGDRCQIIAFDLPGVLIRIVIRSEIEAVSRDGESAQFTWLLQEASAWVDGMRKWTARCDPHSQ